MTGNDGAALPLRNRFGGDDLYIEGEKVVVRPVFDDDLTERYLGWLNDPEVNRYSMRASHRYTETEMRDYVAAMNASPRDMVVAVCLKENNLHIGNVGLTNWEQAHGTIEISNLIGEKNHWGQGVVIDADRHIMHAAFQCLGIEKFVLRNLAPHRASTFKSRQLGGELEGRLRAHVVHNGKRVDVLQFGVMRTAFYETFPDLADAPSSPTPA